MANSTSLSQNPAIIDTAVVSDTTLHSGKTKIMELVVSNVNASPTSFRLEDTNGNDIVNIHIPANDSKRLKPGIVDGIVIPTGQPAAGIHAEVYFV